MNTNVWDTNNFDFTDNYILSTVHTTLDEDGTDTALEAAQALCWLHLIGASHPEWIERTATAIGCGSSCEYAFRGIHTAVRIYDQAMDLYEEEERDLELVNVLWSMALRAHGEHVFEQEPYQRIGELSDSFWRRWPDFAEEFPSIAAALAVILPLYLRDENPYGTAYMKISRLLTGENWMGAWDDFQKSSHIVSIALSVLREIFEDADPAFYEPLPLLACILRCCVPIVLEKVPASDLEGEEPVAMMNFIPFPSEPCTTSRTLDEIFGESDMEDDDFSCDEEDATDPDEDDDWSWFFDEEDLSLTEEEWEDLLREYAVYST